VDTWNADPDLCRHTGHKLRNAGQLPSVEGPPGKPAITQPAAEPRQLPNIVDCKDVGPIKRQDTVVVAASADRIGEIIVSVCRPNCLGERVGKTESQALCEPPLGRGLQRMVV